MLKKLLGDPPQQLKTVGTRPVQGMRKKRPPEEMIKEPVRLPAQTKKKARATQPPEGAMKKKAQATLLVELRQRKEEIVWEKKQLDLEEVTIDKAIAEEEFHFRVMDSSDEDGEGVEEDWVTPVEEEASDAEEGVGLWWHRIKVKEESDAEEGEDLHQRIKACVTGFEDVEEAEEDVDEDLEAGASDMNEGSKVTEEDWYASKWWEQNGDAQGIPKKYTPCSYFFKAPHGCRKKETCEFSHNERIFCEEPFASLSMSLSWERKEKKTTKGRKTPRPPAFPPPHRQVKEEDFNDEATPRFSLH